MNKLLIVAVLALLVGGAMAQPRPGDPAPDFSLPDTAWVNHSLYDWYGKVVLLNFWQST